MEDSVRDGRSGQESSLGKFQPYPVQSTPTTGEILKGMAVLGKRVHQVNLSHIQNQKANGKILKEMEYLGRKINTENLMLSQKEKASGKRLLIMGLKGLKINMGLLRNFLKGMINGVDPQELNGKWYIENQTDGDMKLLGGRPSIYDEKISDLMDIGLSREDAIRWAYKSTKTPDIWCRFN